MTVDELPRRVAHATYALLVTARERNAPVTSAEIVIYDEESFSAQQTAAALRGAAGRRLAVYTGRYWVPTQLAYALYGDLESRYLADRDAADDRR